MILCAGEALIDMLPRQSAEGEDAFAPYAGGAVFNTAIALGRLGAKTGLFTGLSDDLFGDVLRSTLAASNVSFELAHETARPTTLAFVKLTNGHASYAFYDENTAGRMLCPADLPDLPAEVSALFFGGISLVGEPCGTAYETLMSQNAGDRAIMIDPNIRPSFITDEAAYRARMDRMIAMADIVKLSDEDLHWLCGPGETSAHVQSLLKTGPALICITEGANGVTGYTAQDAYFVPSARTSVADTVGAGDTFNAGVLASLAGAGALNKDRLANLGEDTVRAALTLGVRAAAVTVSRPGANPPWASELA